jgi:hypothetical protein
VTTTSIATPTTWEDEGEININGTLPSHANQAWTDPNLRVGIFDLKAPDIDYPAMHLRFNPSPPIPPRAVITAATISGAAQDTQSGVLNTEIEICANDGLWNIEPKIATPRWVSGDVATKPLEVVCQVYDSISTLLASTTPAGGFQATWPLRRWGNTTPVSPARDEKIGEVLTIATAGTLDTVDFNLTRFGAPTGNIWCEVYSVAGGLPDTLLATSDLEDVTTVAAPTGGVFTFTFTGPDAIALSLGVQYAFVVTGDWTLPALLADYVTVQTATGGGAGQFPVGYGEGRGLGSGNYPGVGQLLEIPVVVGSSPVPWNMPPFVINTVYTTPSLVGLVQSAVNQPTFQAGDLLLFRIKRTSDLEFKNRGFKSWVSPDTPGVVQFVTLSVAWRRRRIEIL